MVDSAENARDAVIRIDAYGDGYDADTDESFDAWQGSGFLIHPDGTAVTSAHVIAQADALTAYVAGGTTGVAVEVVGFAPCIDVAVIRLAGSGYPWLRWARQPRQRQRVTSVGHPDGSIDVRTANGRIEAISPADPDPQAAIAKLVRTDVPVRPGSSGGPLVGRRGAVVGVVHAALDGDPDALAISSSEAQLAVTRIRQGHHPADIGVVGRATLHRNQPIAGVHVLGVAPDSPAGRSGVRRGDMITSIDGHRIAQVNRLDDFCRALQDHTGPQPVHVVVCV
jgi:S1-C subfamily serine protease